MAFSTRCMRGDGDLTLSLQACYPDATVAGRAMCGVRRLRSLTKKISTQGFSSPPSDCSQRRLCNPGPPSSLPTAAMKPGFGKKAAKKKAKKGKGKAGAKNDVSGNGDAAMADAAAAAAVGSATVGPRWWAASCTERQPPGRDTHSRPCPADRVEHETPRLLARSASEAGDGGLLAGLCTRRRAPRMAPERGGEEGWRRRSHGGLGAWLAGVLGRGPGVGN
eukprot:365811-Chlamydomonas_euryale.AAC.30